MIIILFLMFMIDFIIVDKFLIKINNVIVNNIVVVF